MCIIFNVTCMLIQSVALKKTNSYNNFGMILHKVMPDIYFDSLSFNRVLRGSQTEPNAKRYGLCILVLPRPLPSTSAYMLSEGFSCFLRDLPPVSLYCVVEGQLKSPNTSLTAHFSSINIFCHFLTLIRSTCPNQQSTYFFILTVAVLIRGILTLELQTPSAYTGTTHCAGFIGKLKKSVKFHLNL